MKIIVHIFILLLVSSQLFGSFELVTLYKENGLQVIEHKLNQELASKNFWDEYLKNVDTSNGYYDSIEYTLVCQSDMKKIHIYKNNKKEQVKIFESDIMTGKNNGAKLSKGDLKTPLGAYDLINKLTTLDSFYGPLALVTSYPNNFDKINGRTGDGIWIHGLPTNGERDSSTKGCIALDNANLELLDKSINYSNAVLIIENNITDANISNKSDMAHLLANFYSWKNAWEKSDFETYISFYSQNFKKTDGSDIKSFISYKKSLFDRKEKKQITFKDINIIPYPNEENKNMYKIKYYQIYSTKNYNFAGKKELYVELIDDKISILYEG